MNNGYLYTVCLRDCPNTYETTDLEDAVEYAENLLKMFNDVLIIDVGNNVRITLDKMTKEC